jgi:hypothetical protein
MLGAWQLLMMEISGLEQLQELQIMTEVYLQALPPKMDLAQI